MRKLLPLILGISTIVNAQQTDVTNGLVFYLSGDEVITNNVLTSSDTSTAVGTIVYDTATNLSPVTHSEGMDGSVNGAFNFPVGSSIEFKASDVIGLPTGGVGTSNGVVVTTGSDRTYAAWIKGTALEGNVLSFGSTDAGQHVHLHLEDSGTTVKMGHWSHDWKFENLTSYSDGVWHHVVLKTYEADTGNDEEEIELFIDGVSLGALLQTNGSEFVMNTNINNDEKTLTIARRNDGSKDYTGEIDDLRIYNRALTNEEILELFALKQKLLSVDGLTDGKGFQVFSNSLENTLMVESNQTLDSLYIVSITGVVLKNIKANEVVDISDLATGVYFVVGESGSKKTTRKFVKN